MSNLVDSGTIAPDSAEPATPDPAADAAAGAEAPGAAAEDRPDDESGEAWEDEPDAPQSPTHRVVGIGASAGGLDALTQLFESMPDDTGLSFVVVQHLSPDHPSMMPELLARHTRLRCKHIEDGEEPEADTVHLLPPKHYAELREGRLRLVSQTSSRMPSFAVDHFFRSLAKELGQRAIAVVLSGSGSDGSQGVRAVNEGGGIVMIQSPETAGFDGMPRSAAGTGVADFILEAEQIPEALTNIVRHVQTLERQKEGGEDGPDARVLNEVFATLNRRCGIDFSNYKPSTTMRRIERRMVAVGATTIDEYLTVIERDGGELDHLHRDLLIGVTKFFRDPRLFRRVELDAIPRIFERPGFDGVVRLWAAGCSTGEEAYTLAILVKEYMEANGIDADVKVFATDVDRLALERASSGFYSEGIAADVSPDRLDRFFVREEGGFRVVSELRNMLVFAPQNLLTDPPFTRIDLVSCRNVLIYLEPATQRKLLALFHFALRPGGFLFLGSSETVGDLVGGFVPIDVRAKLFRRGDARVPSDAQWTSSGRGTSVLTPRRTSGYDRDRAVLLARFHAALVDRFAPTSLLVDRMGHVLQSSGSPERFLRFSPGAASLDIGRVARPGLAPMITTAVQRALRERVDVVFEDIEVEVDESEERLPIALKVSPLVQSGETSVEYLVVSFQPLDRRLPAEERTSAITRDDYVQALESELRHNRDNLSATIEELETANEELQATNEELLAANEELQSTNEELQATNEELHTVNGECQRKIRELEELNTDIENFFRTANVGTLFLDEELRIRRFTPAATQVVNLLRQDVGRPLYDLSDRIGGGELVRAARRLLQTGEDVDLDAKVGDRSMLVQVRRYEPEGEGKGGVVITFIDVSDVHRAQAFHQEVLDCLPERVAVLDDRGEIVMVNRSWERTFERGRQDLGANYLEVVRRSVEAGDESARPVLEGLREVLAGNIGAFSHEYPCHDEEHQRFYLLHAVPLPDRRGCVVSHVDITARVLAQQPASTPS